MSDTDADKLSIPACRAFHQIELSGVDENLFILFGG